MKLREWRDSMGISAAESASRFGIRVSTLYGYENGSRRPRPEIAKRIEAATDGMVLAADLLGIETGAQRKGVGEPATAFDHCDILLSVPKGLLEAALEYDLKVENLLAEGGLPRLREAFKLAYLERHRDAIDQTNEYIRKYGTPSEQLGMI